MNKLILFALIFAVLLLVDTDAWRRRRRRRRRSSRRRGGFLNGVRKWANKAQKWAGHVHKWAGHVKKWTSFFGGDESPEDMTEQELMDLQKNEEFVQLMQDMVTDAMKMNEEMATDKDDDAKLVQLLEV